MGFRSWLLRPFFAADTTGDWFVAFKDILEANKTHAGVSVTQSTALGLPAVYRCRSLNSSTVASLPLGAFRKDANGKRTAYPRPSWMRKPNDDMTMREFIAQLQDSLEADGNGFALKAATRGGQLAGLYPLNPEAVDVCRDESGKRYYEVAQFGGAKARVEANEMLHIRGFTPAGELRGISPIAALKQAIGLGLASQQFAAQFLGSGATMSGVIEHPGADPGPDKAKLVQEAFTRKHGGLSKSHAVAILFGGAKFTPLSVKPEEAQFLESRKFNAVEIAHAYGVPPEYVTDAEGAKGFVTGMFARQHMWLLTGIDPRLLAWEDALTELLPDPNAYVKFNRNAFLAMDPTERAAFYEAGLRGQWLVPDEIREKEDMDQLPGGDAPLMSVQWQSANDAMKAKVDAAGSLVRSGYDPAEALKVVGLPNIPYLDVQPVTVRPVADDGTQLAPAKTDKTA